MGHDKRHEKIRFTLLKRRFYLGLFVFLPVFFSIFALAAPLIILAKIKTVLRYHVVNAAELASLYENAEKWTLIFFFVALISGLVVAYGLIRPARKLLRENLRDIQDVEEFSSLGKEFTEIAVYLKKYTSLLESTTGGVMALSKSGDITMANLRACQILGFSEFDLIGKNIMDLLDIKRDFDSTMSGEVITSELNASIGKKTVAIGYTLSPIRVSDSVDGAVFNFMDTTKLKEMYRETQKTERLASIGSLAMEVAHEVRNPLASIKGLVQLVAEDPENDAQRKLYTDTILKEIDRLNRVVDTLSEKKTPFPAGENLRELLHRILLLCGQAAKGKAVKVTEDYDENASGSLIKDERLFHAAYNIIFNAYEAVEKDGEIKIKTKRSGDTTTIEISSDSELSPGITAGRIFDPNVTTKGEGHGMGLKIARDAIKNLGGDIRVESAGGKTIFTISLPEATALP